MIKSLLLSCLAAVVWCQGTTTIQGDPKRFKYIEMKTPLSGPCDVSEGPDGLVYVQELLANKIVRYNQHTGVLTEFDIPFTTRLLPNQTLPIPGHAKAAFLTCAIRNGFDGFMYFSNGNRNQLVQHDVHTGVTKVFTPPGLLSGIENLQPLNDLTTAPDGVYFSQTNGNSLKKFDYKTHQFTNFEIPTPLAVPIGMYYASDGGIWFLEFAANKIGRLDRNTGNIEEFDIPAGGEGPTVVRAETKNAQGDHLLWFSCTIGGSIASVNERTGEITVFPESVLSNAVEVAQDHNNNIWISHIAMDTLGVFNPKKHNFTEIIMPGTIVPAPASVPLFGGTGIYSKPIGNPVFGHGGIGNAIWFTQLTENRLVRFDINGLQF